MADAHRSLATRFKQTWQRVASRLFGGFALPDSSAQLVQLLDTLSDPVGIVGSDGTLVYVNRAIASMLGQTKEAMVGSTWTQWLDRVHPDDRAATYAQLETPAEDGASTQRLQYRLRQPDGNYLWLEMTVHPLPARPGDPPSFMFVAQRIEGRKLAEEQLRLLAAAVEATGEGLFITDAPDETGEMRIVFANEPMARMSGYTTDELLGQSPLLLAGLSSSSERARMVRARLAADGFFETTDLSYRKDGTTYPAEIRIAPIRDESGAITHYVSKQRDISERARIEQALEENEALFRAIAEAQLVGITITEEASGRIVYCNQYSSMILGLPAEALVGRSILDFYADPADRQLLLDDLGQNPVQQNRIEAGKRADGSIYWGQFMVRRVVFQGEPLLLTTFTDITEQRETARALEESEQRYRTVIDALTEGVVVVNSEGVVEACNTSAARILGVPNESLVGKRVSPDTRRVVTVDGVPMPLEAYPVTQALRTGERQTGVILGIQRDDNEVAWLSMNACPLFAEGASAPTAVVASFTDITAYQQAQMAEGEQRALAEALRDTAAALISTLDQEEVFDRILTHVTALVPHETADIALIDASGVTYVVATKGVHRKVDPGILATRLSVEKTHTLRTMMETRRALVAPDVEQYPGWTFVEETAWIRSYMGVPIQVDGDIVGFLHLNGSRPNMFNEAHAARLHAFADLAALAIRNARLYNAAVSYASELEERVAERTAELELERKRLSIILGASGEGIFYTENRRIYYANQALCEMTGYSEQELLGQPSSLLRVDNPDPREQENLASFLDSVKDGRVWRSDARLRRKDGTEFDAGLTISLIGEPGDAPLRMVTVVRDISQEKALQTQKARFVAHASHELRTPLTNLITRLYLLRRRPELLDDHLTVLEGIAEWMRQLVEDLLDISRFERGVILLRRQETVLQDLVRKVVQVQTPEAEQRGLTLEYSASETPIYVLVDGARMTQVITNLVVNAINYTPAGGRIGVQVTEETDVDGNRIATIAVEDTGVGIAAEHLSHIFQPFFRVTGDVTGTGLGLSIAHEIVHLHDSEIAVESQLGHGSRFSFRLCVLQQPQPIHHDQ